MAYSRSHLFNDLDKRFSEFGKAIAHPVRIEILRKLLTQGPMVQIEIAKDIPLSQSTLSNHLKILINLGFVKYDEQIPFIHYSIQDNILPQVSALVKTVCQLETPKE